jgi:hypothetical protein
MRECLKQLRPDAVVVVDGVDMVDVYALAIRAGGTVDEIEALWRSGVLTRDEAALFELWPSLQTVAAFRRPN